VTLDCITAEGLWATRCDPHQLENAILNLAINGRDAMPEGGRLTIATGNAVIGEGDVARHRLAAPGDYVTVSVTDTGTGMTPDVIAKAFDPFFTTKPFGQGTGLGLSMIYGFVRQSGGFVDIDSAVGAGSTLRLYLPRDETVGHEEEVGPAAPETADAPEGATVLVVEDEAAVRALIVQMLRDMGHRTLEAVDGPSGLEILTSEATIDLLISDVGLPGLNGRQMADAGRQVRPGLKVLFVTGYAHNAAVGNGLLEPGMEIITKPFSVERLAGRVRAIIAPGQGVAVR
jgi:CheY-like chemotaxis protein